MKYQLLSMLIDENGDKYINDILFYDLYVEASCGNGMLCLDKCIFNIRDVFDAGMTMANNTDKNRYNHNKDNLIAEADTIEELKTKVIEYLI